MENTNISRENPKIPKVVSIGAQSFDKLREGDYLYIDKTSFIKEWWESGDDVTLITRPRRFGKTLNMDMVRCFFSNEYMVRSDLFEGLSIWEDEKYHTLQGTFPVVFLSFANAKGRDIDSIMGMIKRIIVQAYRKHSAIMKADCFSDGERADFSDVRSGMPDFVAADSLNYLCEWLSRYYGKNPIILIDEYDTPMQEAWLCGCWDEISSFFRTFFNSTLKTNPHLESALLTGITRVAKESIFSDLNNLKVVSVTSDKYARCFGFTEEEVFAAMDAQGIDPSEKELVKKWYDGYVIGGERDIYNPWSVTYYLDVKRIGAHWGETSSNGLVGRLLWEAEPRVKEELEDLMVEKSVEACIDEYIVFPNLDNADREEIYSLLLASGYMKAEKVQFFVDERDPIYTLSLTNFEIRKMFGHLIRRWFKGKGSRFNEFVSAMFKSDVFEMNEYINTVTLSIFSSFDTGKEPSEEKNPERFYHGFVLGLLVDKAPDYVLRSNRESGYGRYDVVMEPKNREDVAVIMEFKVQNAAAGEDSLEATADAALLQIEEKRYDADLISKGIPEERIFKYGFAFRGKECLIKKGGTSPLAGS